MPESDATSLTRRSRARSSVADRERRPQGRAPRRSRAPGAKKTGRVAKPHSQPRHPDDGRRPDRHRRAPRLRRRAPARRGRDPPAGRRRQRAVARRRLRCERLRADARELLGDDAGRDRREEGEGGRGRRRRARARAAAAAARRTPRLHSGFTGDILMVSPGSGEVRWPLLSFVKGRGLWDSGYHQGVDMLAPGGTPIYAAAAGVVRVSQESFGGYGVARHDRPRHRRPAGLDPLRPHDLRQPPGRVGPDGGRRVR